jgi:hypothetical protein
MTWLGGFLGLQRVWFPEALTAALLAACLIVGCGGKEKDPLGRLPVSGTVTLDGAPLGNGTVRFEPFGARTKTTATGAIIIAGEYSVKQSDGLPPGKYTAAISSHGEDSKAPLPTDPNEAMNAAAKAVLPEEKIPSQYNTATELVIEVVKGGANKFNFDLKSATK